MLANIIKEKLSEKLKESNYNINYAEKTAGLSQNTIRNLIEGTSVNPKIETLYAIAKLLNCSIDELVGNESINKSKTHGSKETIEFNQSLFNDCTNYVCHYIQKKNFKTTLDKILFFIDHSYKFCFQKKDLVIDKEFIEWLIDANLK